MTDPTIKYLFVGSLLIFFLWLGWRLFFRRKQLPGTAFNPDWKRVLLEKVHFYGLLPQAGQKRFEQAILQFFEDVTVTGIEVEIDDTDRLLVAASAVIPLFGFPEWRYRNLNEVLLYEGNFNEEYQTQGEARNVLGMVGSGAMQRMMILSKPALHQGFENNRSKTNVGIHEFVHLLDKADGSTDGVPEVLMGSQFVIPWIKLMHNEIKKIKHEDSDINPYGANNEAEFLSVVSEYFFKQPQLFKKNHGELYALMEKIYHQELGGLD